MKKIISSSSAPVAPKLLSQAILVSEKYRLEISGQVGLDAATGKLIDGGVETEMNQAFQNVEAILAEVGWTLENITKVRLFLADMADYPKVNEIYSTKFTSNLPTRIALAVKSLPLGAVIEIECEAAGDEVKS